MEVKPEIVGYDFRAMLGNAFDSIFPIVGTIAAVLLIIWLIRHWK